MSQISGAFFVGESNLPCFQKMGAIMATTALKPLAQPQHNTAVAVNRESIARNYGVSTDAVAYAKVGQSLDGIQVLYDEALQRTYPLPAGVLGGSVVTQYSAGKLTYASGNNIISVDLNALCVKRGLWFILYGYDFSSGAIMQYENDVLEYYDPELKAYSYYRWAGTLPFTVTAGSTPNDEATKDDWVIVGTQAVSSALAGSQGASQIGWGTTNVGALLNDHAARILKLEELPDEVVDLQTASDNYGQRITTLEEYETALKAATGLKNIGKIDSIATLRTTAGAAGDWVRVASYIAGKGIGGGFFYWKADTKTTDDSGTFFRVDATGGWVRDLPADQLTINHFGALPDGATDAAAAILAMHKWSYTYGGSNGGSATYGPGIVLSVGTYAVSSIDLGTTEITSFKLRGPECTYGTQVRCRIKPLSSTTTTPMFKFCARFMEVANINWFASNSTQPFVENTVTRGAYVHVHCFIFSNNYGIVFNVMDTIDTKFNEIYAFTGYNSFLWVHWSNQNPGSWDHPTAIEISNSNFTGVKGNNPVINAIRAGQSIIRNTWFTSCGCPMDISQGGWLLDTLIVEGATSPILAQYAKVTMIGCRVTQGATWDWGSSGYTTDMDSAANGGSGKIPNWVTNGYDQGKTEINTAGIKQKNGLAVGFNFSENRYVNTTGAEMWVHVGKIVLNSLGYVCKMRFLGASGWDTAGSIDRPGSTGFGGGEAILSIEAKSPNVQTTTGIEAHWYSQDNSPINEIRIVHLWNGHDVYIKLRAFARCAAMFMNTSDLSRLDSGSPFYFQADGSVMEAAAVTALANNYVVPKRWSINAGDYSSNGLGMDLDTGSLLLYQANKAANAGNDYLTAYINGQLRYIPFYQDTVGIKLPMITLATLATLAPNTYVARQVIVSDAKGTYGRGTSRVAYSDGYGWYWFDDNTAVSSS